MILLIVLILSVILLLTANLQKILEAPGRQRYLTSAPL